MEGIKSAINSVEKSLAMHPYHPTDLQLDAYMEPQYYGFWSIMITFFGFLAIYIPAGIYFAGKAKHLHTFNKFLFIWFLISGAVHILVEAPYVLRPDYYKRSDPNVIDELWKEYGKADSRYAIRDPSVVLIEAFAAFVEGPLCLLTSYLMYKNNPWWIPTALSASFPELYGTIQYGCTLIIDNFKYTRPEALYFWFYLVFMNQFWFFIPLLAIGQCFNLIINDKMTLVPFKPRGEDGTNGKKIN